MKTQDSNTSRYRDPFYPSLKPHLRRIQFDTDHEFTWGWCLSIQATQYMYIKKDLSITALITELRKRIPDWPRHSL